METTTRLESLISRRLTSSTESIGALFRRLHEQLQGDGCPLADKTEFNEQDIINILRRVTTQPIDAVSFVSLSTPLERSGAISDQEHEALVMKYLTKSLPRSVGKKLGKHLASAYWQKIRGPLGDDSDELSYALLNEFGDIFRAGLGLKTGPQSRWLAPDSPLIRPDSLLDLLWGSFCLELYYYVGLLIAGHASALPQLKPLIDLLPRVIPLGTTERDEKPVWIIPCK